MAIFLVLSLYIPLTVLTFDMIVSSMIFSFFISNKKYMLQCHIYLLSRLNAYFCCLFFISKTKYYICAHPES